MRSLSLNPAGIVLAAVVSFFAFQATAEEREHHVSPTTNIPMTECVDRDVPLGDYGYKHCSLHKHGSIQELIERSGGNCCDGGNGGECRATALTKHGDTYYARLDGMNCPVNVTTIFEDISLPDNVLAMVCASSTYNSYDGPPSCPSTYCAAVSTGF